MHPAHVPHGFPVCRRCHRPAIDHRVEHKANGDPCHDCGLPESSHRSRPRIGRASGGKRRGPAVYWGIDGEGKGRERHKYVMLAAVDEFNRQQRCVQGEELSTAQCLEFLLDLPASGRYFAYSFLYDLSMMLKDLPTVSLYSLMHEELRQRPPQTRRLGPRPVKWGPYKLNLQRTKFSVERGNKRIVIWDIWRFFQDKFVAALRKWDIGTDEELKRMQLMKDQRGNFDRLSDNEVKEYCFDECAKMGQLARKLVNAHEAAGLSLRTFYGAGSSASAMLKLMGIKSHREDPELKDAVARAFFGGRFENSIIGEVPGPVWGYDISSAYPYQLCFLPCLQHGRWELTRNRLRIDSARHAIIKYTLGPRQSDAWAPFPFRISEGKGKGSICFPAESGGGWIYRDEYVAGEKLFPNVAFEKAWIYQCDCSCEPFKRIPEYYLARLALGKEAAGIVLKLGMNSCYGKLAQSIGLNPPFQCWLWAGMITSGCRAQILEFMGQLSSLDALLMVATDGVYCRERVQTAVPRNTGTYEARDSDGKLKPLGGWEEKLCEKGIFAARPGIYFPMHPTTDELKEVRARGVGKATLLECWETIVKGWKDGQTSVKVANVVRFQGAKTAISVKGLRASKVSYHRSNSFGQWVKRPIELSFNPLPKRADIQPNGALSLRNMACAESAPYQRAIATQSEEALMLRAAELEAAEQADGGDFVEYEVE